jgi:trans-aconitate methyltransferase
MNSEYTFGDSDTAARRLELLADAFVEPSRAFLAEQGPSAARLAIDLGCGPGYTTRLLREVLQPRELLGLDRSQRFIEMAIKTAPANNVRFVCCDVLAEAAVPAADLVYARFLLTHLSRPDEALRSWSRFLAPDGQLLVQETSRLVSEHPTLTKYYQFVEVLQAQHEQSLYIGRELERTAREAGLQVHHFSERTFEVPAHVMATLHALNLPTWKSDPVAKRTFDGRELADVEQGLLRIAQRAELCAPVRVGFGELVARVQ